VLAISIARSSGIAGVTRLRVKSSDAADARLLGAPKRLFWQDAVVASGVASTNFDSSLENIGKDGVVNHVHN
jgi:hypothetical protein